MAFRVDVVAAGADFGGAAFEYCVVGICHNVDCLVDMLVLPGGAYGIRSFEAGLVSGAAYHRLEDDVPDSGVFAADCGDRCADVSHPF